MQTVSISFLDSFEKDNSAINELCRTCLCKTDDEYVSIHSVLPWSQQEVCTAEHLIQQVLNRELSKKQPQPQRICSRCIKKIRAISAFRNQCLDADNILNEFHKHMEQRKEDIKHHHDQSNGDDEEDDNDDTHNDFLLDFNEMFMSDDHIVVDNDGKDFMGFQSDLNSNRNDTNIIVEELEVIPPTISRRCPRSRKSTTTAEYRALPLPAVTKKTENKTATGNSSNNIDKYVHLLIEEDITASLKSLEKKYKREQLNEVGGLCEQCGLSFSNTNEYKKHIRGHDDKAKKTFKFHCKFCSKGFNHRQTYNIHHNSHTREQKFICDMCGKTLATKNSLRVHFRYHLGIKNHACDKCGHRFVTPRELRDHVDKKHAASSSRAIACTYSDCTETFDSEYRLNLHIRVHETNYAYRCDICGVATVSKFRLRVHKKIHTGELIRQCPICQKKLAHDNALRRHIRTVHNTDKSATAQSKRKSELLLASASTNECNEVEQAK